MSLYETIVITRPELSTAQVDTLINNFVQIVTAQGGNVSKIEYCGLRTLAYRMKKHRKAHYTLMNVTAPANALQEMERNMRISEDVLRYLSIKVDAHEAGPSALVQSKSSREGRDSRRNEYGNDSDYQDKAAEGGM